MTKTTEQTIEQWQDKIEHGLLSVVVGVLLEVAAVQSSALTNKNPLPKGPPKKPPRTPGNLGEGNPTGSPRT